MTTHDVTWPKRVSSVCRETHCPDKLASRLSLPRRSSSASSHSSFTSSCPPAATFGNDCQPGASSSCYCSPPSSCSSSTSTSSTLSTADLAKRRQRLSSSSSSFSVSSCPRSPPSMTSLTPDCAVLRAYWEAVELQEELRAQYETCKGLPFLRRYAFFCRMVRAATAEPRLRALRAGARSACTCSGQSVRAGRGLVDAIRTAVLDVNEAVKKALWSSVGFFASSQLDSSISSRRKRGLSSWADDHDWQRSRLVLLARHLEKVRDTLTRGRWLLTRYTAVKAGLKHVTTARMAWRKDTPPFLHSLA